MTSALLQLPLSMSKREKQQRVVAIIEQLVRALLSGTSACAPSTSQPSRQHTRHRARWAHSQLCTNQEHAACLESSWILLLKRLSMSQRVPEEYNEAWQRGEAPGTYDALLLRLHDLCSFC